MQLLQLTERSVAGVEPATDVGEKAWLETIVAEIRLRRVLRQANVENPDVAQP